MRVLTVEWMVEIKETRTAVVGISVLCMAVAGLERPPIMRDSGGSRMAVACFCLLRLVVSYGGGGDESYGGWGGW